MATGWVVFHWLCGGGRRSWRGRGICEDPADYRWSSYGKAVGGGKGEAQARAGLVRALHGHSGRAGTTRGWEQGGVAKEYRRILISGAVEQAEKRGNVEQEVRAVTRKGMSKGKGEGVQKVTLADPFGLTKRVGFVSLTSHSLILLKS